MTEIAQPEKLRMHCAAGLPCSYHNLRCQYPNCLCGWEDKRKQREEKQVQLCDLALSALSEKGTPWDQESLDRASWELQRHFGREGSLYGIKACEEIARIAIVAYSRSNVARTCPIEARAHPEAAEALLKPRQGPWRAHFGEKGMRTYITNGERVIFTSKDDADFLCSAVNASAPKDRA